MCVVTTHALKHVTDLVISTNHSLKMYREDSDNVMVINYNKLYFLKFGLTNLDIYMNGNT